MYFSPPYAGANLVTSVCGFIPAHCGHKLLWLVFVFCLSQICICIVIILWSSFWLVNAIISNENMPHKEKNNLLVMVRKLLKCLDVEGFPVAVFFVRFKAVAHWTQNCKKCSYLPYTLRLFHNCNIFPTVYYMSNNFLTDFFRKIFAVLCVVCKGLYSISSILILSLFLVVWRLLLWCLGLEFGVGALYKNIKE